MTILVAGATGKVGRHIVSQLAERGQTVRALTRDPTTARFSEPVEVVTGDLTSPDTLVSALDGVSSLHLTAFGGDSYAPLRTGQQIARLARRAGVTRVTVLTGTEDELAVVRAVEDSGIPVTHVRPPAEFMANALQWADSIKTERVARVPFGDALNAMIHEADVASVIAHVLLSDGHAAKTYEPTGPETITRKDAVQTIGRVIGRQIHFEALSDEQAREEMRQKGIPEDLIDYVVEYSINPPAKAVQVAPVVEQVTGRRPRSFATWVQEHAARFAA